MTSMSESKDKSEGLIYKKIPAIMRDLSAVGKDRKNPQQGYQFRGVDDVLNEVHPILAKHGVFVVPKTLSDRTEERNTKSGGSLIYRILMVRFRWYAEDGSFFDSVIPGEGMDSGDKASNKAMSAAVKYNFIEVLAIPTVDQKDSENQHHEVAAKQEPAPRQEREDDEGYDPQNRHHQNYLIEQLRKRKIPDDHWDDIGKVLKGKPASDLQKVIDQVMSK